MGKVSHLTAHQTHDLNQISDPSKAVVISECAPSCHVSCGITNVRTTWGSSFVDFDASARQHYGGIICVI